MSTSTRPARPVSSPARSAPPARPRPGRGPAGRVEEGRWRVGLVTATATLATSLCLLPVLDGGWWLPRTAVAIAAVAVAGALSRSLRVPPPLQPVGQALALVVTLTILFAGEEAIWGILPGTEAMASLQDLLAQGRNHILSTVAPAGPDEGLLLILVAGVGLAALCADSLAAGLDLPGLALVPLAALHVVPWAIAGDAPTWTFALVALAWLAVLASTQRDRASSWGPRARPGTPAGAAIVAGAAVGAALLAGSASQRFGPVGTLDLGSGASGGTVRVDALVSLRRSLVENDTRQVITYSTTADQADYLRLAVLESFTGVQWVPARATQHIDIPEGWPPGGSDVPQSDLVGYELDVGPLAGATIPSPTGTTQVRNEWPVGWDIRTSLPVRADGETIGGTSISLVVAPPEADADALRAASRAPLPRGRPEVADNLVDPEPLTGPELPTLADQITAGTATPFDAAVALQRWFRSDGGFTYSTAIPGGSGRDALADFLEERVGYCEQYAATMALMARSVGIPARVVVGFTQGRFQYGRWVVRGTDAHAWPELWMGSAGWIRFEPTPGVVTATAPSYSQPGSTQPDPTGAAQPEETATPENPDEGPGRLLEDDAAAAIDATGTGRLPVAWIVWSLVAILLLAPMIVRRGRRLRRLADGRAEPAYREVVDTMADLGMGREAPTPRTTVGMLCSQLDGDAAATSAAEQLLSAVEAGRYGRPGEAVDRLAARHAQDVIAGIGRSAARWSRVRAALLPRSLVGRRRSGP